MQAYPHSNMEKGGEGEMWGIDASQVHLFHMDQN